MTNQKELREELRALDYPSYGKNNKMTKDEVKKALEGRPERCFGYILDENKKENESILLPQINEMEFWAHDHDKFLDTKMIFFGNSIDALIELIKGGKFTTSISFGDKYYEFDDYVKEMNYKYLLVYKRDDSYVNKFDKLAKKHEKLMTLCGLRDIKVIAVKEVAMKYYNLKSEECSRIEWDSIFYNNKKKFIKQEMAGDYYISTVFLGIEHLHGDGILNIFETMVFDSYENGETGEEVDLIRYDTIKEAREGHKKMVEKYLKKVKT